MVLDPIDKKKKYFCVFEFLCSRVYKFNKLIHFNNLSNKDHIDNNYGVIFADYF